MTHTEQQVLEFIEGYTAAKGYPPSYREIGAALGVVKSCAYYHCTKLVRMGKLSRARGKVRTLKVVKYD